jgi:hypothetical protein
MLPQLIDLVLLRLETLAQLVKVPCQGGAVPPNCLNIAMRRCELLSQLLRCLPRRLHQGLGPLLCPKRNPRVALQPASRGFGVPTTVEVCQSGRAEFGGAVAARLKHTRNKQHVCSTAP